MSNYLYPATVESNNEGGFIAKFRDVPEAITEAWDLEELKNNARDALISAIDFYIEDRKAFPVGSIPLKAEKLQLSCLLPWLPRCCC